MIGQLRGITLIQIRPISDLRNKFADISKTVHENHDPIYLTKNGYADMVVMSVPAFEKMKLDTEIYIKLKEAELETKSTATRYSSDEVFSEIRSDLDRYLTKNE